ncbi:hypothetical protein AUJ10_02550 [Candidatus Pacearchaeota archaeon CG1_02_31_27]|nr:MAG: hypothetical protein AUJ10_02550 [Candidatus Pacearchaeota archaeon CG1_02_31_27]PIN92471.1 MAG: hypothetical protein COU55_01555 [Candidatus Pacearchaeota archaeon CG10_big_fil_rev_8_21_14_0_10_31_59]PIZ80963.1 MAG: hypothetical protein COX99_01325 [Candidatus Pacearchaeota archaeon CG_4_10_14_0_2_um_filter_31_10]
MATTIQISGNIKTTLDKMKLFERETYNDIIERMIEDDLELNERTKKDIEEARKQVKAGKVVSHGEVEKRIGLR